MKNRLFILLLVASNLVTFLVAYQIFRDQRQDVAGPDPDEGGQSPKSAVRPTFSRAPVRASSRQSVEGAEIGYVHSRRTPKMVAVDGHLTSHAAAQLGLDQEKAARVQNRLSRFWNEMTESVKARTVYDDAASKRESDVDIYRLPALPDHGKAQRDELHSDLVELMGESSARSLVQGLGSEAFGGFGRYDVVFRFVPDPEAAAFGTGDTRVHYDYRDPETGQSVLSVSATLEKFTESFGDSFERVGDSE
jgi:hypothetical protein